MRTIIIGYGDESGGGKPRLVAGPHVEPAEQINLMDAANRLQRFPKDIKRLEYFEIPDAPALIASHLGEEVGEYLAADAAKREQAEKAAAAAQAKAAAATGKLAEAEAKVKATARARNELMGKLHQAQTSLRNHEITSENLRGPSWAKNVEELKKLILGDPKEKVEGLEVQVKEAIAAYDAAVKEFTDLAQPLNAQLAPEPKDQMAAMK